MSRRPGEPDATGFADRIGREVVVQHEVHLAGAFEAVDELLVIAGAESCDHEGLRLAAGEDGRAVGTRQHAHFSDDRADSDVVVRPSMRVLVSLRMAPRTIFGLEVVDRASPILGQTGACGDLAPRSAALAALRASASSAFIALPPCR
jgi:hypothetical protein